MMDAAGAILAPGHNEPLFIKLLQLLLVRSWVIILALRPVVHLIIFSPGGGWCAREALLARCWPRLAIDSGSKR